LNLFQNFISSIPAVGLAYDFVGAFILLATAFFGKYTDIVDKYEVEDEYLDRVWKGSTVRLVKIALLRNSDEFVGLVILSLGFVLQIYGVLGNSRFYSYGGCLWIAGLILFTIIYTIYAREKFNKWQLIKAKKYFSTKKLIS